MRRIRLTADHEADLVVHMRDQAIRVARDLCLAFLVQVEHANKTGEVGGDIHRGKGVQRSVWYKRMWVGSEFRKLVAATR
jgi:hypothetical protein